MFWCYIRIYIYVAGFFWDVVIFPIKYLSCNQHFIMYARCSIKITGVFFGGGVSATLCNCVITIIFDFSFIGEIMCTNFQQIGTANVE